MPAATPAHSAVSAIRATFGSPISAVSARHGGRVARLSAWRATNDTPMSRATSAPGVHQPPTKREESKSNSQLNDCRRTLFESARPLMK